MDQDYIIEIKTSKGWEVVASVDIDLEQAIERFRREQLKYPIRPVRLTSPTDLSIYGANEEGYYV